VRLSRKTVERLPLRIVIGLALCLTIDWVRTWVDNLLT
jgi:hypothetical protein